MPLFFVDNVWELTPEELELARMRVRRHRLAAVVALVLVATGILGAHPAVHAMKDWPSRRLAAQALGFIDHQQWPQASGRAADAGALQPAEPMALRAYGRLLACTHSRGPVGLDALTLLFRRPKPAPAALAAMLEIWPQNEQAVNL